MEGLLPVWKPAGITSYDVIRSVKRNVLATLPQKVKIGHAGTLDPFAEGVLILMLGRATRRFDEIQQWRKSYRAAARLGYSSDTLDATGKVIQQSEELPRITQADLESATRRYTGTIKQSVPAYSAAKYRGTALYVYARKGIAVPEKSKPVTVYSLSAVAPEPGLVILDITCSSGTYIRQLSHDLFRELGAESYLESLIRTSVGAVGKESCLSLDQAADAGTVLSHLLPHDGVSGIQPASRQA